jgi:replicative DNA helicase
MNFIETYKQGKAGMSKGLPTGIEKLDIAMNGTQRKAIIAVAAAPKVKERKFVW